MTRRRPSFAANPKLERPGLTITKDLVWSSESVWTKPCVLQFAFCKVVCLLNELSLDWARKSSRWRFGILVTWRQRGQERLLNFVEYPTFSFCHLVAIKQSCGTGSDDKR